MAESDNSSPSAKLLTPRNLILGAALVLLLSVIGTSLSMLRPNDSGGMARDSYGVTSDGYRGLLETLEALGVGVERSLAPPEPGEGENETVVLFRPDPMLVAYSPRYLHTLLEWVDDGGRLVVSPSDWAHHWANRSSSMNHEIPAEHDILKLLGVDKQLQLEEYVSQQATDADAAAGAQARASGQEEGDEAGDDEEDEFWPEEMRNLWSGKPLETAARPVEVTGSLAAMEKRVQSLALPKLEFMRLVGEADKLAGSISVDDGDESPLVVAAVKHGNGEIVVISEPRLFANGLLAKADNSVLAVNLLSPQREQVVFDEFYHGLAVRGNALYLFTRPGYAAAALGLLLAVAVWMWRKAVFLGPHLPDIPPARRDIGQYIDAMGDFFVRGPDHRRFLMREIRDGTLQQLCQELKLPPDTTNTETILSALERRSPSRANLLRRVLRQMDALLTARGDVPKAAYLPTLQQLASCL